MAVNVIEEARRCLQCRKPMCRLKGCPAQTNIPEMIRLFLDGKGKEAGAMLFENNPMSVICSLVCDHGKQCEGNCIRTRKDTAVRISSIEHYISEAYLDWVKLAREASKGQKVGIIGSGPAGITVAVYLAQRGYDVTVFERKDKIGGMMRYGIPDFRLPKTLLDRYQSKLRGLGIRIRPNVTIGGALHLDDLFEDGYDAVFIGSGAWRPRRLGVKGESLGHVHYAVDYLQNPEAYELGERVAVIGAGNSAVDAALTAVRRGAREVTIYSRSRRIAASGHEVEYAKADGVDFQPGMRTLEITDEGPVFKKVYFDEENNVIGEEEEEVRIRADSVVISVSQRPKDKIVRTTTGVGVNDKGLIMVDAKGQTTREGVFSGGDVVLGPWNVVEEVRNSKEVAQSIVEYLEENRAKG